MNKPYKFKPFVFLRSEEAEVAFSEDDIKSERSIYGGSIDWTLDRGDKITRFVTEQILNFADFDKMVVDHALKGYHPVIDTRVTMLLNENQNPVDLNFGDLEMYQAIPGWHCDGVIRKDKFSQPDPKTVAEDIRHFICSFSAGNHQSYNRSSIAPTQLIIDPLEMVIDDEKPIWAQVDAKVRESHLKVFEPRDGDIIEFSRPTIHRSTASRGKGWRFFYRLSFYHMPAINEFRVNNNVYIASQGGGW
jgi:hypothetical protein